MPFSENISKIDDIQASTAGEKAVVAHLEAVKKKKLEEAKDDEEKKERIKAEYVADGYDDVEIEKIN